MNQTEAENQPETPDQPDVTATESTDHDESSPVGSGTSTTAGLRRVTLVTEVGATVDGSAPLSGPEAYLGATVDDRYVVESLLGEGGMGVVFRCRHTIIGKLVAMKILRADLARSEEVVERFLNEARSASSIGNPHIIDISDFGRLPDGATYFVMEYLDGMSLGQLLDQERTLDDLRAGTIAVQIAEGLAAAHAAGIVHRDLKPDNVYLIHRGGEADFVKILDFGIAKATSSQGKLTQSGQVFGTPHYMSPEQATGAPVDHRSDIYSLGIMLFEMTTGQLPFDAENYMGILTQHMYREAPLPTTLPGLVRSISPEVEEVILRCLQKNPADRFQTMTELAEALHAVFGVPSRDFARDESLRASLRQSRMSRATQPSADSTPKKSSLPLVLGALLVLAVGAGAFLANREPLAPAPREEPAASAAAETTVDVAVAVQPLEAHVFIGEKDLGVSPLVLEVGKTPVEIEARAPGHRSQTQRLDGKTTKVRITLEPLGEPTQPPSTSASTSVAGTSTSSPTGTTKPETQQVVPAAASAKSASIPTSTKPASTKPPKKSNAGGEIVDPWGE